MATGDRLQKVLARAGIASRRHAEELIAAGRVRVNGKIVTEPGTRVVPHRDRIEVDGRRIVAEPLVYYIFHKPRGTVTTLDDPEGRATIAEYLRDLPARVYPIGRLDFHTSGALLLTNDGDLAQALLHPRRAVPKTYVAKVRGVPTDLQIEPWRKGMEIPPVGDEPGPIKLQPVDVEVLRHAPSGEGARSESGTTWMKITLREGRNRQIHRMAEAVGLFVMRLARIAFAGITTEGLRPGDLRPLTDKEVTLLRATYLRPVEEAAARKSAGAAGGPHEPAAASPRGGAARTARAGAAASRAGAPAARAGGAPARRTAPSGRAAAPSGRAAAPTGRSAAPTGRSAAPTSRAGAPTSRAGAPTGRAAAPTGRAGPGAARGAAPRGVSVDERAVGTRRPGSQEREEGKRRGRAARQDEPPPHRGRAAVAAEGAPTREGPRRGGAAGRAAASRQEGGGRRGGRSGRRG